MDGSVKWKRKGLNGIECGKMGGEKVGRWKGCLLDVVLRGRRRVTGEGW